jgi:predicted RNA-binding protein
MCLTTVYLEKGDQKEMIMEEVAEVEAKDNGFRLISLMGEEKFLKGRVKRIDFITEHSLVIKSEEGR